MRSPPGLEIALPEIDVHPLVRLRRVAPQLARLEPHAVERLRLLAETVGIAVGEDVHAVQAVDQPALAARVARQPRVAAGMDGARDHGIAGSEARPRPRLPPRSWTPSMASPPGPF